MGYAKISERVTDEKNMLDVADGFVVLKGEEFNDRRNEWT